VPADLAFDASDAGAKTAAITFKTAGVETLTAKHRRVADHDGQCIGHRGPQLAACLDLDNGGAHRFLRRRASAIATRREHATSNIVRDRSLLEITRCPHAI